METGNLSFGQVSKTQGVVLEGVEKQEMKLFCEQILAVISKLQLC